MPVVAGNTNRHDSMGQSNPRACMQLSANLHQMCLSMTIFMNELTFIFKVTGEVMFFLLLVYDVIGLSFHLAYSSYNSPIPEPISGV